MTKEQHFEQEFDRLYSEGKVGQMVLDDNLPDFRDNWIAEKMAEVEEYEDKAHKLILDSLK